MSPPRNRSSQQRQVRAWTALNQRIEQCDRCPRLLAHCGQIAADRRAAFRDQPYWGRPVPNFGDPTARMVIVGLAPGAHGANRTGRMFTGDRSGDWLYRSLHKTGFASQPESVSVEDGLELRDCVITGACHCAPPDNKPAAEELSQCAPWLNDLFDMLPVSVIVALGGIGWNAVWKHFREHRAAELLPARKPKFGHAAEVQLTETITLLGSYHPSQQNTFTGRLTAPMLNSVFRRAAQLLDC